MFLCSPYTLSAALNMDDFQYAKWKWSFTGTLLLTAASHYLRACVWKYIHPSSPPSCCCAGSFPKPVILLCPAPWGTTCEWKSILKQPRRQRKLWLPNHAFSLYLFSFLPWAAISFCVLIPAVPHNLAVHSPGPNIHFHPVVHDKVSPVKREEIKDGRRRMNVCPVRFIIQSFLYHFYTLGFTIELQSCPILPQIFKTWTSLFSLSYNSLSGAALL